MGSLVNPKPWVPYLNIRDCSQGYCSLYCPQWCYIVFPPPPPIEFPTKNRYPINFSPLVIAIIAILASAFLLVSYYAIISKYCISNNSSQRRGHDPNEGLEENEDPSSLEPWHVANNGLDEALIKSITMCKYKRGNGLIETTDCSVCLSEFEEDENVRLLPKCSHAFHVECIDTWLKSHSNCPLCRANIVSISLPPPPLLPQISELPHNMDSLSENTGTTTGGEENSQNGEVSNEEHKDIVIEIRDDSFKQIRRSLSMDFDYGENLSITDLFLINQNMEFDAGSSSQNDGVGSSKEKLSETNKLSNTERGLNRVNGPFSIRRSFSSGRFSFSKRGRGRNSIIPL